MSLYAMMLNPNLSMADIREIQELKLAGFKSLCDSVLENMQRLETREEKRRYYDLMFPIITQQFIFLIV